MSHAVKIHDDLELVCSATRYSLAGLWPGSAIEAEVEIGTREQLIALARLLEGFIPFDVEARKRELAHYEHLASLVEGGRIYL